MQKIFFTMLFILCAMMNISFASPTETGIDDFYFGQPIEEIEAQYELANEKYDEKYDVFKYDVQIPSLDFYGMKIEQPVTLEFKNNNLYGIFFSSVAATPAETAKLYKNIVKFASVQYGKPIGDNFMVVWFTGKIFLNILNMDLTEILSSVNSNNKNTAYIFVSMNEKYMGQEEIDAFKQMAASKK